MSPRAQRWFFRIFLAYVAFQIYVVREWLAGLLLIGVVFAVVALLGAIALILDSALRAIRSAVAFAWGYLAKGSFAKVFAESDTLAGSKS